MTTENASTSAQNNTQAPAQTNSTNTLLGDTGANTSQGANANVSAQAPAANTQVSQSQTQTPKGESKAQGAPETYQAFTLPEGMEFDAPIMAKFTSTLKELNLSQEKAQALVTLAAENAQNIYKSQEKALSDLRSEWVNSIKSDQEFGGQKLDETVKRANRALTRFGSPTLRSFLDQSGYGDNPEIIKLLAKVDRATGEDSTVRGAASAMGATAASVMYPNQGKQN